MKVINRGGRRAGYPPYAMGKALRAYPRLWLYPGSPLPGGTGNMERKRLLIFYSGRVQGVGFRFTVKSAAQGFEVTGTVRNLADGRVELIAEGPRDELIAFQQGIKDSEAGAFIKQEEVRWEDPKNGFRGFEIVR